VLSLTIVSDDFIEQCRRLKSRNNSPVLMAVQFSGRNGLTMAFDASPFVLVLLRASFRQAHFAVHSAITHHSFRPICHGHKHGVNTLHFFRTVTSILFAYFKTLANRKHFFIFIFIFIFISIFLSVSLSLSLSVPPYSRVWETDN